MKNTRSRFHLFAACTVFVLILTVVIYIGALVLKINQTSKIKRVIGIDVSSYQGKVDWKSIEKQGISFAYIKATEGASLTDSQFKNNWKNIDETNLKKGAYLYYDFNQDGQKMADYFISTVPKDINTLPPAVDVELSQDQHKNEPSKENVIKNLKKLLNALEKNYQENPIIYTNEYTFQKYFSDEFKDIDFWIADVSSNSPDLKDHNWIFWQFSWRGILNGYDQDTEFVDMNLYNGNLNDFYHRFDANIFEKITHLFN